MSEGGFHGWLNPLLFIAVDWPNPGQEEPVSAESVLDYICKPQSDSSPETLAERYREVSCPDTQLHVAPTEERLLSKLVWPLKDARACHMVGNYLGTIALCGMVAEMVALLVFEMNEMRINDELLTQEQQRQIFGDTFEKLGQYRRIRVLQAHRLITPAMVGHFDAIRGIRKKYLHYWSQDHDDLQKDSADTCRAALSLVVEVVGQKIEDGKIKLSPGLIRYLERKGMIQPAPAKDDTRAT